MLTEEQIIDEVCTVSIGDGVDWMQVPLGDKIINCYCTAVTVWDAVQGLNCKLDGEGFVWGTMRYGMQNYFDDVLHKFAQDKDVQQWLKPVSAYVDSILNHPEPDYRAWAETKGALAYIKNTPMSDKLLESWRACVWDVYEEDVDDYYSVNSDHLVKHVAGGWKIYFRLRCGWNSLWTELAVVEIDENATLGEFQAKIREALKHYTFVQS